MAVHYYRSPMVPCPTEEEPDLVMPLAGQVLDTIRVNWGTDPDPLYPEQALVHADVTDEQNTYILGHEGVTEA